MSKRKQEFPDFPKYGFVRLPHVLHVFPISPASFWQGIKDGRFPAGIKIGPNTTAWRAEEIRALIDELS